MTDNSQSLPKEEMKTWFTEEERQEALQLAKEGKPLTKRQVTMLDREERVRWIDNHRQVFNQKIRDLDKEMDQIDQLQEPLLPRIMHGILYPPAYLVAFGVYAFHVFKQIKRDILDKLEGEE